MTTSKKKADLPRFRPPPEDFVTVEVSNGESCEAMFLALQLMAESGYKLSDWYLSNVSTHEEPHTITFERDYV